MGNLHISQVFTRGYKRMQEIKRFFCVYDPRTSPTHSKAVMFKVQPLMEMLLECCKKYWTSGEWVSIDEQTIGFQGRHKAKLRITYKAEGDGFQCDAVCENGYTIAFLWRHEDAPPSGHGLSQLHERTLWLMKQLSNDWTAVFMDNLYTSTSLARAAHAEKTLIHGVARKSGRGLDPRVIQVEEKSRAAQDKVRGTVKVSILRDDPSCPNLFALRLFKSRWSLEL
eukprot:COSAG05_NODE_2256_length_3329_cov_2.630031_4_plen_225_part_00